MRPTFSPNNCANGCPRYAIVFRQLLHRHSSGFIPLTNLIHLYLGKLYHWSKLANHFIDSILLGTINHVVFMRSKKQMFWVAAFAIVAFVAYANPLRNIAISNYPCHPMRFYLSPSAVNKVSISTIFFVSANATRPVPAFRSGPNIHLFPKTHFHYFAVLPQMTRIAALPIFADMHNLTINWPVGIRNSVSESVGRNISASVLKLTVPMNESSFPQPAFSRLPNLDFTPKSLFNALRIVTVLVNHSPRIGTIGNLKQ